MKSSSPFGFAQAQESPGFLLWQTTMLWQRLVKKALEPHAISHAQFVIMATLLWFELQEKSTTQIDIIHWSKLDKMTVSKSLKKLVALKLVNRIEHKTDTRAKSTSLTPTGKKLVKQLIPLVEKIDVHFFGRTTKQDQRILLQIFQKLIIPAKE
ncbi:MAG: MarR family winged helix-turn-helix transcriptional regulator [Chthoniobacterales bacterium]|nr:MarR family winged helix-turn-helix transcriptional regulator [Chthoniobacterales bacterium]